MMLYRNVLNFLRGSVQVEIECACPERVLNLCAVEEIAFWDLQWLSPIALRLRVTRRGWRALREVCTRADAQASRLRAAAAAAPADALCAAGGAGAVCTAALRREPLHLVV